MFNEALLILLSALILASVIFHQVGLLALSMLIMLSAVAARLWHRYCLSNVEYERQFGEKRVFFGEEVDLRIRVSNRKLLPLAWLEIEDDVPDAVSLVTGELTPHFRIGRAFLRHLLSLRWYERITRRYRLRCNVRGFHAFGPVRLRSGDIFGFYTKENEIAHTDYLLVYPKVVPISRLGIPSKQPFGDLKTRQHMFEDPSRLAGVREWTYGDSLRKVHWKATARTQELQVKVYESTTSVDLIVFLDLNTFEHIWQGIKPIILELSITTAASIVKYGIDEGYRAGLVVNSNLPNSDQLVRIMPSQDPEQLTIVLEALAKVPPFATVGMDALLARESRNLPWGATIVVVTALATDGLLAAMLRLKKAGHKVALILTENTAAAGSLNGIIVYNVGGEEVWNELQELQLA